MSDIIVGFGEIGKAVFSIVYKGTRTDKVYVRDLQVKDSTPVGGLDVMHVCFPYSKKFVQSVKDYAKVYEPKYIVIWSTVPIGTTKQIPGAVHSPVESRHPGLALGIKQMVRWIGANDVDKGAFFEGYFNHLSMDTKVVGSSDFTEALKLLSTTEYGINIVFADYKKRIADDIGMDFELTKEWNRTYNKLYHRLGLGDIFQKFVLDAPQGKIGGHCVRENSRILDYQYPDDWVKRIGEMK